MLVRKSTLTTALLAAFFAADIQAAPFDTKPKVPEAYNPWSLQAEIGVGFDSNVYRTPSDPYIDFAPTIPVAITPNVQSGFFVPLEGDIQYHGRHGKQRIGFVADYGLNANIYPGSELENATTFSHALRAGAELLLGRSGRKHNTLSVLPYIKQHQQTYSDRDDGLEKTTSVTGTDISERYSYIARGLQAELRIETPVVPFKIWAEAADLDYEDPVVVDQYDQRYTAVGAEAEIPFGKYVDLVPSLEYQIRDFEERRALDLNGNLVTGTTREYLYNIAGLSLRTRFSRKWTMYLDYQRTEREDTYVGYYDFSEDKFGVRLRFSNDLFSARMGLSMLNRDYPNAFAFDNTTQPSLEYQTLEVKAKGEYKLAKQLGLWLEGKYWDQDTTDSRYIYDRYQLMLGLRWES